MTRWAIRCMRKGTTVTSGVTLRAVTQRNPARHLWHRQLGVAPLPFGSCATGAYMTE